MQIKSRDPLVARPASILIVCAIYPMGIRPSGIRPWAIISKLIILPRIYLATCSWTRDRFIDMAKVETKPMTEIANIA